MAEMIVEDAMTKKLITAKITDNIVDVAKKMSENDIGSMLITKGDKLLGLITSEDLVKRIIIQGKDPKKTTVKEIMTKKVLTVPPDDDLEDAVKTMIDNDVKRLPVVDNNKLVGILTDGDIMRISPKLIENFLLAGPPREPQVIEGICEICGNYSDNLRKINGRWVCEECAETSTEL